MLVMKACLKDGSTGSLTCVEDFGGALHLVACGLESSQYPLLTSLDWFSDNTFEGPDALALLTEFTRCSETEGFGPDDEFLRNVEIMVLDCSKSDRKSFIFGGDLKDGVRIVAHVGLGLTDMRFESSSMPLADLIEVSRADEGYAYVLYSKKREFAGDSWYSTLRECFDHGTRDYGIAEEDWRVETAAS